MKLDGGLADEEPLDFIFIGALQVVNMSRPYDGSRCSRDARLGEEAPNAPCWEEWMR